MSASQSGGECEPSSGKSDLFGAQVDDFLRDNSSNEKFTFTAFMSEVTILAVLASSRLHPQLKAYVEAQRPHFRVHVVTSSEDALVALQERRFDSVWYECDDRATGLAEVAMVFAPHEVIALVSDQGVASMSLDKGASAIAHIGEQGSPWPVCAGLTEVALGREAQLRALRLTEQRFEGAIRAANLGLWHWSVAHRQLVVDERLRRLLGYTNADEIKTGDTPWISLIPEHSVDRTRELIHRCLVGSADFFSCELSITGPNGLERAVLIAGGVSHRTKRGEPIQMAGMLLSMDHGGSHPDSEVHLFRRMEEKGIVSHNWSEQRIRNARRQLSTILGYGEILLREEPIYTARHEALSEILSSARSLLIAINGGVN